MKETAQSLIGPFKEVVTMEGLPLEGPLKDQSVPIVKEGGILLENGIILEVGPFEDLKKKVNGSISHLPFPAIAVPGFIDCHTHLCFAGSRVSDYAKRVSSMSYLEIAKAGGGILDTVKKTRAASKEELIVSLNKRLEEVISQGITSLEIKSGYGLTLNDEIKQLEAIKEASLKSPLTIISTCLAAHICPPEFSSSKAYLDFLMKKVLPLVKEKNLAKRVDIFVENGAFEVEESIFYLNFAKTLGFEVVVHADQFHPGGSNVAKITKAISADHLEASSEKDLLELKEAGVIPVALPGASIGLGMAFTKGRKILDLGMPLVIASDWNPGSAPMGNLLAEAAIFGAFEKLTISETLAAITSRASHALSLKDCGILKTGYKADFTIFETSDYRDIFYYQGSLKPSATYIKGTQVFSKDKF
ncbi:imidazolonepropionase [Criblamydia sequanensis]|uniref:Imidazolonepropionase n=1 Tax=Candidatus Criblamydia sequanensis CRIB-18 TaxID=1437425 RepID=A0A090CY76_9BACT|nr:imidazolonepropionase [Criblamydia sequanensis]CDR33367.1 Imidazolonepropionase [Criblamydia sequanensis CRIB-18]